MDAILYLRREHSKFRKKLVAISKMADTKLRISKFNTFTKDLVRHEAMEQKIWYPYLRKHTNQELRKTIQHLVSEEKSAGQGIKKIKKVSFDFIWNLKFYKLKRDIDHHAKEEEQELFPKVRKLFSKQELSAIGTKMRQFKMQLKK